MSTRTLPGHPVESGAGYDCNCGACLSLPERRAEYELGARVAEQRERLAANGAAFTYDRNGLRLGIAALEDELRELYDEWAANKKRLHAAGVAKRLRDEVLDVAAVAMLIYRNVPGGEQVREAPEGYPCPDCGAAGVVTDPDGGVVEDPCSTCWGLGRTDLPVEVPEHLQPPVRPF